MIAIVSLLVQFVNLVKVDLKPIKDKLDEIDAKTTRIEQRLEDHERRLQVLERTQMKAPIGQPEKNSEVVQSQ